MDLDELRRKRKEEQRRRRKERLAQINLSAPPKDPVVESSSNRPATDADRINQKAIDDSDGKPKWQTSSSRQVGESNRAQKIQAPDSKKSLGESSSGWFDALEPPNKQQAPVAAKSAANNSTMSSEQSMSGGGVYMPNGRKDILDKELTSPASSITFSQEANKSHLDGTPQQHSTAPRKVQRTPDQNLMKILEKPTPPSARQDLSPLFFESESPTPKKKQSTTTNDFDFPLADPPESASLNLDLELDLEDDNPKDRGAAKKMPPKRARRMSSSSDSSDDSFDLVKLAKQKEEKESSRRQALQSNLSGQDRNESKQPPGDRQSNSVEAKDDSDRAGPSSPIAFLDSSPQHDSAAKDSSQPSISRKPRNPLTRMKEEAEASKLPPIISENRSKFTGGGLDDQMWADDMKLDGDTKSDGEDSKSSKEKNKKSKKKRNATGHRESPEKDFRVNAEGTVALPTIDFEMYLGRTDDEVDTELKPDFPNPSYGVSDLAPLKLSACNPEGDGEDDLLEVEVPASIARYLIGYQKEGVKFCFEALIKNGGCILGDGTLRSFAVMSCLHT